MLHVPSTDGSTILRENSYGRRQFEHITSYGHIKNRTRQSMLEKTGRILPNFLQIRVATTEP